MLSASDRGLSLPDPGSFEPVSDRLRSGDPLSFPGYPEALERAGGGPGVDRESVAAGPATIAGIDVELACFDFSFLGGSMGEVAGERLARGFERAADRSVPFVLRTATGGARMQEGMRALIQMPKVVAARLTLARAGQPFVVVFGDPTTGGVLASVGALADVTFAERGATVGFAGPRVVESVTGRPLRRGSHTAESAFEYGLVDEVVEPGSVHETVARALAVLAADRPEPPRDDEGDAAARASSADDAGRAARADPWQIVQRARSPERPTGPELIGAIADAAIELRGDREGTDDRAIVTSLARVRGRRALLVALDRAKHPGPGAYRKAVRCLSIAARLGIPVVTLVDTPGADPSEDSEAAGIAWAIAELFSTMLELPVPTASFVTGEGGSGGALAFATTDHVAVFEDAFFSVIGPEAAAAILWRDPLRAADAARVQALTPPELLELNVVDQVVSGALSPERLRRCIVDTLDRFGSDERDDRAGRRRDRWRLR